MAQPSVRFEEEVARPVETHHPVHRRQQQAGVHAGGVPGLGEDIEGALAVLDPYGIDIGRPDRVLAQQGPRLLQPAAGLQQQVALVGDGDGGQGALFQMADQAVAEVMGVDHGAGGARVGQPVQHVVDQGPSADFDQGLGPVVGQGPHARADARRENHGCLGRIH